MSRLLDESFVLLPTPVCSLFSSPGSVFGFGVPTRVAVGKLRYAWQSDYLAKCLQEVRVWLVLTQRASSLVQAAEYQPALFAKRADLELRLGWYGWVIHFCVRASERPWVGSELAPGGATAHVAKGLVVGIFFGGAIVAATYWTSPEPPVAADLVVRGFNELLFPVGCSLVLFSAQALGKRLATD